MSDRMYCPRCRKYSVGVNTGVCDTCGLNTDQMDFVTLYAENEALRTDRDGFARTALEQRALLDEARELVEALVAHKAKVTWAFDVAEVEGQLGENDLAWIGRLIRSAEAWLARAGGENGVAIAKDLNDALDYLDTLDADDGSG